MKLGYIGLGRMGKNMVLHLLEQGIEVVAFNRSQEPISNIKYQISNRKKLKENFIAAATLQELVENLPKPRIIWLMLPAGDVTDQFIDQLLLLLSPKDLIIEGANSFYKDTLRRWEKIKPTRIHFMDIGVSGGPGGARIGACLMIGGAVEDFQRIEPIAKAVSAKGAYQHLGPIGAGHFAKMVHNGIEYGMMEALGEGLAVLKNSPFKYDFNKLLDIYNHRSVIESRLVGWAQDAFKEDPQLKNTSSQIGSGGTGAQRVKAEADWTADCAEEYGIDALVIKDAIKIREQSANIEENSPNGFRNKVVSALRGQFGQHAVKK